ncbi:MAG: hypothetical protein Q8K13_10480 [Parvibaculum sp.]|uniref:hypothetical protein n=1 Tax=Parvibaculum sp. TaxID=2024848 RepID=UPI002731941B|nr:hypothetical protein [Parvibaculum sp.]MDP2150054.1 hypothetical protein [Parvibaculum sp.]
MSAFVFMIVMFIGIPALTAALTAWIVARATVAAATRAEMQAIALAAIAHGRRRGVRP